MSQTNLVRDPQALFLLRPAGLPSGLFPLWVSTKIFRHLVSHARVVFPTISRLNLNHVMKRVHINVIVMNSTEKDIKMFLVLRDSLQDSASSFPFILPHQLFLCSLTPVLS